eukprot:CAMPEP_0117653494 /NCGR_PEP_ID=MMETSP0804-20121206/3223_1 /TAXON_ID=1074897 /ORGANISM="Tetraselmis astigmatica, Strain CCMP880" /LENGTH=76 /DNA_ID=CAMNT_0005459677 /DNA_START=251 /DNA_END=481 /DNA_ORIENTATION=-
MRQWSAIELLASPTSIPRKPTVLERLSQRSWLVPCSAKPALSFLKSGDMHIRVRTDLAMVERASLLQMPRSAVGHV